MQLADDLSGNERCRYRAGKGRTHTVLCAMMSMSSPAREAPLLKGVNDRRQYVTISNRAEASPTFAHRTEADKNVPAAQRDVFISAAKKDVQGGHSSESFCLGGKHGIMHA
eukprot:609320-Rhodomonas_salina.3